MAGICLQQEQLEFMGLVEGGGEKPLPWKGWM